jgi:hypothetical protein
MFASTQKSLAFAFILLNRELILHPSSFLPLILTLSTVALPVFSVGEQSITGNCTTDADCADGCCGFTTGKCAAAIVAQESDGGCGFGDAAPNDNQAQVFSMTGL